MDIFVRLPISLLDDNFKTPELKMLHITVMSYLLKYAHNQTGELWINITKLANELKVKKTKLQRVIKSLMERGYIKKTGYKKVNNHYFPMFTITLYEKIENETMKEVN